MGDVRVPDLNKIVICGRLAADPDLRYIPSGAAVCKLCIVNTRYYRNRDGERNEDTCFINATIWERQAEFCGERLSKGRPVLIEGRLKQENWEDKATGQPRSRLVIAAQRITPLDWDEEGRSGGSGGGGNRSNYADRAQNNNQGNRQNNDDQSPYKNEDAYDDEPIPEDDIPF